MCYEHVAVERLFPGRIAVLNSTNSEAGSHSQTQKTSTTHTLLHDDCLEPFECRDATWKQCCQRSSREGRHEARVVREVFSQTARVSCSPSRTRTTSNAPPALSRRSAACTHCRRTYQRCCTSACALHAELENARKACTKATARTLSRSLLRLGESVEDALEEERPGIVERYRNVREGEVQGDIE